MTCMCFKALDASGMEKEVCVCEDGIYIDGVRTMYRSVGELIQYEEYYVFDDPPIRAEPVKRKKRKWF